MLFKNVKTDEEELMAFSDNKNRISRWQTCTGGRSLGEETQPQPEALRCGREGKTLAAVHVWVKTSERSPQWALTFMEVTAYAEPRSHPRQWGGLGVFEGPRRACKAAGALTCWTGASQGHKNIVQGPNPARSLFVVWLEANDGWSL